MLMSSKLPGTQSPNGSHEGFVVTLDGPAGSGKTTLSELLADHYGFFHLIGGTFLRSFTYFVVRQGIDPDDEGAVTAALQIFPLSILEKVGTKKFDIRIGEEVVNDFLWSPLVEEHVSKIASFSHVRERRKLWLRSQAYGRNLVADGRTLGTEIFPNADVRFYLDASIEERAKRRWMQRGTQQLKLENVIRDIKTRDGRDRLGNLDRLAIHKELLYVDSSNLTLEQVLCRLMECINPIYSTWLLKSPHAT